MKMTTTKLSFLVAIGLVGLVLVQAGDLDPSDPPAPTMVTLQDLSDKLDSLGGGGGLAKTGQTGCWDATGTSIACVGTGQDGEFQAGASAAPRFTDNTDGTVTDNLTNLTWLKDANCFGARTWANALTDANGLANGSCTLTDGSVVGDWRLPNIRELQSLVDFSQSSKALPVGHPFTGFQFTYWSSTTLANGTSSAWFVSFSSGSAAANPKSAGSEVLPVRGGL